MSEMKPGRELDALIAEKVMGFVIADVGCGSDVVTGEEKFKEMIAVDECDKDTYLKAKVGENLKYFKEIPNYSTDISAAWEVVEKIKSWQIKTEWGRGQFILLDDQGEWIAGWYPEGGPGDRSIEFSGTSESASHAICLAALKAVENKND